MKRFAVSSLLACAISCPSNATAQQTDLMFGAGEGRVQLGVAATWEGQPAEAAWTALLKQAFEFFDRDGDGSLSQEEAARVFAPLGARTSTPLKYAELDSNADGRAGLDEFQSHCRRAGFEPLAVEIVSGEAAERTAGEALFRCLDENADDALDAGELRRAAVAIRRLD